MEYAPIVKGAAIRDCYGRFRAGEAEAFRDIVAGLKSPLAHFLQIYVQDEGAAHQLANQVFVEIYQQAYSYPATSQGGVRIFRVARRIAQDHLFLEDLEEDGQDPTQNSNTILGHLIQQPAGDPLCDDNLQEAIEQAFGNMPPIFREILFLRFSAGFGHREIGEILDLDAQTVRARLDYALLFLCNAGRK